MFGSPENLSRVAVELEEAAVAAIKLGSSPRALAISLVATASVFSTVPFANARDAHALKERVEGWSAELAADYDGSRSRTAKFHQGLQIEWGSHERWASLSADLYDDASSIDLQEDGYITLELGGALHRDNAHRFYVNATVEIDLHSLLADRGWDLSPSLDFAWGITEDWWLGGDVGAVFATHPDPGNTAGYPSITLWLNWQCGLTPAETDSMAISLWAAGNEVRGDDNCLFAEFEYTVDLLENVEASIGVGTDIISPWEHQGVYFKAGVKWSF